MFRFLKKGRKYLDIPTDKRKKAHIMLDRIIDEPDYLLAFDITENLNEYVNELKTVYEYKELLDE